MMSDCRGPLIVFAVGLTSSILAPACRQAPRPSPARVIPAGPTIGVSPGRPEAAGSSVSSLLLTTGLPGLPAAPSTRARRANERGLRAHKAGDFAKSRALFSEAVELAPGFSMARFNLGCALARLGELEAAAKEIGPLLEHDLYGFAPLLAGDADLAGLRQSPAGKQLAARAALLEQAWKEASRRGVVSLLASADDRLFRPGVYLHEQRRFFPLARQLAGARAALVDLPRRLVIQIVPTRDEAGSGIVVHPLVAAKIVVDSIPPAAAGPVAQTTVRVDVAEQMTMHLQVQSTDRGARLRWDNPDGGFVPWRLLAPAGLVRDPLQSAGSDPTLRFDRDGSYSSSLASSYTLDKGQLRGPGLAVDLDRRARGDYNDVAVGAGWAVVTSTHDSCACESDEMAIFQHVVSVVDLARQHAAVVRRGRSVAAVRQDAGGAVYLQTETRVERWSSPQQVGRGGGEPVMPGVLLVLPRGVSGCCGA